MRPHRSTRGAMRMAGANPFQVLDDEDTAGEGRTRSAPDTSMEQEAMANMQATETEWQRQRPRRATEMAWRTPTMGPLPEPPPVAAPTHGVDEMDPVPIRPNGPHEIMPREYWSVGNIIMAPMHEPVTASEVSRSPKPAWRQDQAKTSEEPIAIKPGHHKHDTYGWMYSTWRFFIIVGTYQHHAVLSPIYTFQGKGIAEYRNQIEYVSIFDRRVINGRVRDKVPPLRKQSEHEPIVAVCHWIGAGLHEMSVARLMYPTSRSTLSPARMIGFVERNSLGRLLSLVHQYSPVFPMKWDKISPHKCEGGKHIIEAVKNEQSNDGISERYGPRVRETAHGRAEEARVYGVLGGAENQRNHDINPHRNSRRAQVGPGSSSALARTEPMLEVGMDGPGSYSNEEREWAVVDEMAENSASVLVSTFNRLRTWWGGSRTSVPSEPRPGIFSTVLSTTESGSSDRYKDDSEYFRPEDHEITYCLEKPLDPNDPEIPIDEVYWNVLAGTKSWWSATSGIGLVRHVLDDSERRELGKLETQHIAWSFRTPKTSGKLERLEPGLYRGGSARAGGTDLAKYLPEAEPARRKLVRRNWIDSDDSDEEISRVKPQVKKKSSGLTEDLRLGPDAADKDQSSEDEQLPSEARQIWASLEKSAREFVAAATMTPNDSQRLANTTLAFLESMAQATDFLAKNVDLFAPTLEQFV